MNTTGTALFGILTLAAGFAGGYYAGNHPSAKHHDGDDKYHKYSYNYVLPEKEAKEMISHFQTIYRQCKEGGMDCQVDSLSKAIWFGRDEMLTMFHEFALQDSLSGLRFYMCAYNTMMPGVKGQVYPNQSSLIIVPTRDSVSASGSKYSIHKDDWNYFKDKTNGGYNHGELCPDSCAF